MTLSLHLPRQAEPAMATPVVFDETAYAVTMHQFDTLTVLVDAYKTGHLPGPAFEYLTGVSTEGIAGTIFNAIMKTLAAIGKFIGSIFYKLANLFSGNMYKQQVTDMQTTISSLQSTLEKTKLDKEYLDKTCADMANKLADLREKHQNEIEELEEKNLKEIMNIRTEHRHQLEKLGIETDAIRKEALDAREAYDMYRKVLDDLSSSVSELAGAGHRSTEFKVTLLMPTPACADGMAALYKHTKNAMANIILAIEDARYGDAKSDLDEADKDLAECSKIINSLSNGGALKKESFVMKTMPLQDISTIKYRMTIDVDKPKNAMNRHLGDGSGIDDDLRDRINASMEALRVVSELYNSFKDQLNTRTTVNVYMLSDIRLYFGKILEEVRNAKGRV